MKKTAAFFDIDGTLYREGLITEVFKKIIKYELVDEVKWYNEVKPAYIEWDNRTGDYDTYLLKMIDIYKEAIIGIKNDHIKYIAKKVIEQKGDRVYTFTRDRIKHHKKQGHLIIAVSGSPSELVREMALKYDMDDYNGTIYKVNEKSEYNGEIVPMWDSVSKKQAILNFADKYDIDLEKSYAYGDTTGDFSMFGLVGNPVTVNPTKELIEKIKNDKEISEKIKIIVERKGVIYNMVVDALNLL